MKTAKRAKPRGRGRPPNIDPAKIFSTTLPESIHQLLDALKKAHHPERSKSDIITDAIRAYARRFKDVI